jgi:hypothetical protein
MTKFPRGVMTDGQVMGVLAAHYGKPWTESDEKCETFEQTMCYLERRLGKRVA